MNIRDIVFKELIRNGYSESKGKKIWNIANRSFLHLTPEMSKRFLNLRKFKPYKEGIYDRELELFRKHAPDFLERIGTGEPFNLIDIGCGDGAKAKEFIDALKGRIEVRYCPVSPDKHLIDVAIKNIKSGKFKNVTYKSHVADFGDLSEVATLMRSIKFQKNVVLLHDSVLAGSQTTGR